ncbi:SBBP repeat-containing protein [Sphaerospermopsis torques-reginae]|uniref:SBBP repeat-containing protein n=1 Tax=Sphaerospermopsis torques-reginae ITEP-024 TaxID=984208 RepID=A0ABX8X373_9CYAN|nr:SBBP repeat-containing protein [Sphaerospermopsis torques-reginae]QYX33118.1 SBBP repeat-containing protein [Sphaerospermopsis torques-reginae ITEP-024]
MWAQQFGGTSPDTGWNIAADTSGNTYVTGAFKGTATFGNTTLTHTGLGSSDAFIAKLDSNKNVLWAQKLVGASSAQGFGITVDESGNSYATGFFTGTATFGNTTLTSAGNEDAFITKLNSSGKFLWAQKLGGTSSDSGYSITTDGVGNTYVTGVLNTISSPGNINAPTNTYTSDDAFITKLDNKGNILWTKNLGGAFLADRGIGITSDITGNTYATGFFSGTTTFGNISLSSVGNEDGFITKLDTSGNFLWAQRLGGTLSDGGVGITSDEAGNIYVTGIFRDTASFGSATLTSAGDEDAFVAKFDNNGKALWAKNLGSTGVDEGLGIVTDGLGNVYVTGVFSGTASFGSTTLSSTGDADAFIAKLDSNGNVLSAQKFGSTSLDLGIGIASDSKGNIYATGGFGNTATFGNTSLTSAGSIDAFIVKLGDEVGETQITLIPNNTDSVFNLNGAATPIQFLLKSASPSVVNEIGLFTVDDDQGTIDGIAPNDSNYTQAVLSRSRSIFSTLGNSPNGFDTNLTRTLDLDAGIRFRLLLVQNGTLDGLRNGTVPLSQLLLSSPASLQVSDVGNSTFDLRFEDSGSGQFNDAVVQMQLGTEADKPIGTNLQDQQEGEVLDLRGLTDTQTATFTVNREAAYNNFVGFFRVADANGSIDINGDGIGDLLPGQTGYGEVAVKNRVGGINLSVGNQGQASFTGQFEGGSIFAPFLIVNGTPDQFLDSNPNNNPAIYFPYLGANSDKVDHVRMLGNNVFGFEDLPNGGDKDFNDIIVSVKFN